MLKFPPSNVIRSILPPSANLTVPRMTIIKCDTLMFKAWLEISVLSIYDKTKTKKVVVYFFILIIIGVIILVFRIFTPDSSWQSTFFYSITFSSIFTENIYLALKYQSFRFFGEKWWPFSNYWFGLQPKKMFLLRRQNNRNF